MEEFNLEQDITVAGIKTTTQNVDEFNPQTAKISTPQIDFSCYPETCRSFCALPLIYLIAYKLLLDCHFSKPTW